ncbi:MAG TPA: L-seryl-tRNA(Sec) selenium transferase [Sorangium sp.]|nr:L-seryl-tRNA(Sec) selenium transferase [Sorangium sp.]
MTVRPPSAASRALLRLLPKVDLVADDARLTTASQQLGRATVMVLARRAVDDARARLLSDGREPSLDAVVAAVNAEVEALFASRARRVINATGVILHTNLGRAPLGQAVVQALADSAVGYTSIELDLNTGKRGQRAAFAHRALALLTGAPAALVVNNNAAAVLLVLTALAQGRGVVVSRGEQVEIGGGFRVPEVLQRSGARMIEVGTTNRTRLSDYARALDENDDVAVLLRVHRGNFRQTGFVARPDLTALAQLARARGVLLVKDLGGGALVDLAPFGLHGEPLARACVAAGVHLTCFSSDKVLGGPQGGVVVGASDLVARVARDPLARALRLGRLPLVALEATLTAYLAGEFQQVPALCAIQTPIDQVRTRVEGWCARLRAAGVEAQPQAIVAAVGGGTLAEEPLHSVAAAIRCARPSALAARLRCGEPAVMARVHNDAVLLDGRSVRPDEASALMRAVIAAASAKDGG